MQSLSFPFKSLFELIYNSILILINYSINFLGSYEFLLFAEITAVITKLFVLGKIIKHATKSNKFQRLWILLILVVVSALAEDLTWIIKILRSYIPEIDYRILLFCIRASWALAIVQYQSLALFIESLIAKHMKLSWRNIMFLIVSTAYFLGFLYLLIFENKIAGPRPDFEFILLNHVSRYLLIIMLPTIFITMRNLLKIKGPTILRKQLKILTVGLMVPRIVSDFIQLYPFNLVPDYVASNIFVVAISTLLIAYAAYYCTNKVLKLRFLNMQNHVEPINTKFDFINDFKDILEQLSYATTTGELKSIVRNFFNKAFQIPNGRTNLHFRNLGWRDKFKKDKNIIKIPSSEQSVLNKSIVENFINSGSEVQKYIQQKQILHEWRLVFGC